jgi:SAM-dependent methyltransferase
MTPAVMTPTNYDAWYDTPRGRWIGATEYALLRRALAPRAGANLLDVGCGTGWFARRFAVDGASVTGVDPDPAMLDFARSRGGANYLPGDARALPFPDASFACVVSVAALCFVDDGFIDGGIIDGGIIDGGRRALREIVRVCAGRFAVGLLNRASLLWRDKGRDGGSGAYRGAHWHTPREARALLAGLPVRDVSVTSAVFLPSGGRIARGVERIVPARVPLGAMLVIAGRV